MKSIKEMVKDYKEKKNKPVIEQDTIRMTPAQEHAYENTENEAAR